MDGLELLSTSSNESTPQLVQKKLASDQASRKIAYIFDAVDMIVLLGISSKERLIRQLSVVLMAENGKLKRLLVPKETYAQGLYDVVYYQSGLI